LNNFVAFILSALLLVPAFLIAIPVHEMGHAVAAYFLGDRSVRYFGYFRLDPRRFLDPLGVIAVFVALVGWGRRVPVQPNRISTTLQRVIHELGGPAAAHRGSPVQGTRQAAGCGQRRPVGRLQRPGGRRRSGSVRLRTLRGADLDAQPGVRGR